MARLRGTGKDPLGRYGKGDVFDVPADDPQYDQLIEAGYAEEVAPEEDPGRTGIQIADAVVSQGGTAQLADPVDRALAKEVAPAAHDAVHTDNPYAEPGDAGLSADDRDQDERQVDPRQVTASSIASANPEAGARLQAELDGEGPVAPTDVADNGSDDGELKGDALDARVKELGIEGASSMSADEKREAVAKAEAAQG